MTADNARHINRQPDPAVEPRSSTAPAVVGRVTSPAASRRVAAWLGWHGLELVGVGVPLALAVMVDGWWAVLAGVVGAGWASHEIQLARRHRSHRAETQKPLGDSGNDVELSGKDRDHD
ncbi:hypothetical protein [Kibdelosporangium aridum]|uniref:Uncharacterized protein n=1 Tax=Kibdelosporangium aridum TaxID=2030 RepID=A0A1Y5XMJ3_KIBAR|nr:hypothetical protein [Kibdelosporangium aridum]SMC99056.1 hypothetical protein SAMN05661093_03629 [Kibdelosporangium aridum]